MKGDCYYGSLLFVSSNTLKRPHCIYTPQAVILGTSANGTQRISEIFDASEWEDELCFDQLKCYFHVHVHC